MPVWLWILCSGQGDLDNLATKYRRRCSLLYALLVHIHVLRRPPSSVANANVLRDRRHETSSATQLECFNSVFQDHSRVIEEEEAMKKLPSSSFQGESTGNKSVSHAAPVRPSNDDSPQPAPAASI